MSVDLDAIRSLEVAATPGPWAPVRSDSDEEVWSVWTRSGDPFSRVAWLGSFPGQDADARFIAAARTAVPDLLALLDEALGYLRSYVDRGDDEVHVFLARFPTPSPTEED